MPFFTALAGVPLLAQAETRTYFELVRLQSLTEWWQWLLLLVALVAAVSYVVWMYRKDSIELPAATAVILTALRIACFVALLFFFLKLEKRTEKQLVRTSKVAVLVDTSQSMGLQDPEQNTLAVGPSRIEQIVQEFTEGKFFAELRDKHDVAVYRFDEQDRPLQVASFPKIVPVDDPSSVASRRDAELRSALEEVQTWHLLAAVMLGAALLFGVLYAVLRDEDDRAPAWAMAVSCGLIAVAFAFATVSYVRHPYITPFAVVGLEKAELPPLPEDELESAAADLLSPEQIAWDDQLAARGTKTRLGDAIHYLVDRERGGPIAGFVLFTDGRSNAGVNPDLAAELAAEAGIPLYFVGMGSEARPVNVRVVDLEAPSRVYPEDKFTLTGYIQASGLEGRDMKVELLSGPAEGEQGEIKLERELMVTLLEDGKIKDLKFEMQPEASGRRTYRLRVVPREREDLDKRDNEKTATVEVSDRKPRVLVLSGGPSRDYTFLHNFLYRGKERKDAFVDVLLQSGRPGISQDADNILFEFPRTPQELFEYDAIVAFDFDWQKLDLEQVELIDRWVGEKAGGLIVVAGPVNTPEWATARSERKLDIVKNLYPVVFYNRSVVAMNSGRFGSDTPVQLKFTREGLETDFLWLTDRDEAPRDRNAAERASESATIWEGFEGFYGYFSAKEAKPAAKVYARYPDPNARIDGEDPIYLASQFYGAGRVVYLASGEVWRLRGLREEYFEQLYTNMIRWAAHGRLQRDSNRGVLLVDKDRCLRGDTVAVRAHLVDAQFQPLTDDSVAATLIQPDGLRQPLELRRMKDAAREGEYVGQFTALHEGDYRLELLPPRAVDDRLLVAEVRSRVADSEIEQPQRDGALMLSLAQRSVGDYFAGLPAALGRGKIAVANQLNDRVADQVTYLPGTPDRAFDERLMLWLLGVLCGVLSLEWLIRRLNKLA